MAGSSWDEKALRFRSWPCAQCRQIASSISYLIGRQSADPTFRRSSFDEQVAKEINWLREWIDTCSHNEKCFRVASLTQGSEHQVDLELEFGECVVKTTLPGVYGDIYYIRDNLVFQRPCTPYEYLVRLRRWEKLFGLAPQAVGMTDSGQFVSVQVFVPGDPPTQLEVNNYLRQSGLVPVREDRWLWKKDDETRPVSIWVGDARADNFVSHEGEIIPIDLRLWITPKSG